MGAAALAFTLVRELSGQAAIDRAQAQDASPPIVFRGRTNVLLSAQSAPADAATRAYLATIDRRYRAVSRCC